MSFYKKDFLQFEIREGIKQMKEEAIKNNDAVIFNSILSYERNNEDARVLIKIIKQINEENRELRKKIFG